VCFKISQNESGVSWRIKDQLAVTCDFVSLLMCSTCFGYYYIHHQELATILLNYHIGRIVLGSMCVGVSVWLGWSGIRFAGLSGDCDYSVELPLWLYCSWFDVCWSFGVVGLERYPCCRLKHNWSGAFMLEYLLRINILQM